MRTIIMAVAEYERDIIRDRINDGLDKARSEGKRLGRPADTSISMHIGRPCA